MNSLYTAALGMINQQTNVDIISNNLANINTPGFKKSEAHFKDLYYQDIDPEGNQNLMIGLGSRVAGISRVFTQGSLTESTNSLDLAIEGEGFFCVKLPDGTLSYTRDGSFKIDGQGNIVTVEGYLLEPHIRLTQGFEEMIIDSSGNVSIIPLGGEEIIGAGKINIFKFVNPAGLAHASGSFFTETEISGAPQAVGEGESIIRQGYKEISNVNVIEEMVNLISAQRAYEINSKVVKTADEMLGLRNNLR